MYAYCPSPAILLLLAENVLSSTFVDIRHEDGVDRVVPAAKFPDVEAGLGKGQGRFIMRQREGENKLLCSTTSSAA